MRIPYHFPPPTSGTGVEEKIDEEHDATPKDRRFHAGRQRDLRGGLDLGVVDPEDPAAGNQATNANGQNRQRLMDQKGSMAWETPKQKKNGQKDSKRIHHLGNDT